MKKVISVAVLAVTVGVLGVGCTSMELGYGKAGEPGPQVHSVFGDNVVPRSPEVLNGRTPVYTDHNFSGVN